MSKASLRICVVGGGKMGEALCAGWIAARDGVAADLDAASFCVADPGDARRAFLSERYGFSCVPAASSVSFTPDLVVLAVKPQVMSEVTHELSEAPQFWEKPASASSSPLFVSIAAGISTASLEAQLPVGARVVRVMPNTPLAVGAGASGVCAGASATSDDAEFVQQLFACLGQAFVVDESDMDAICAISGSGPAYVAALIEAVRAGGAKLGVDADFAETLFLQTVLGTALMMQTENQSAEQVRRAVCSPGGTTLAALDAMEAHGLSDAIVAGVCAAAQRSKELAAC